MYLGLPPLIAHRKKEDAKMPKLTVVNRDGEESTIDVEDGLTVMEPNAADADGHGV